MLDALLVNAQDRSLPVDLVSTWMGRRHPRLSNVKRNARIRSLKRWLLSGRGQQPNLHLRRSLLADFGDRSWSEHSTAVDVILLEGVSQMEQLVSLSGFWNQRPLIVLLTGHGQEPMNSIYSIAYSLPDNAERLLLREVNLSASQAKPQRCRVLLNLRLYPTVCTIFWS